MATLQDIGVAAAINLLSALAFLVAFAILRLQPLNDRVYFPKWYLKGIRNSPRASARALFGNFVNCDCRTYLRFLNWMPAALKMPEPELIDHAGLDSAVYVRIYLLGYSIPSSRPTNFYLLFLRGFSFTDFDDSLGSLKIFVPITLVALLVLIPVNMTGGRLENTKGLKFSDIDKLSISNIPRGSQRLEKCLPLTFFWYPHK